ncbi:IS30-like element IST3091 family transposase [Acidithiobacillus ferrooxidans]|uniref:IS30-like element IST3091 family transposase n=4 Tax=Acidithiobacillus ferrooxidans TaxID=920 RepID=A0A2W1KK80_ACIFR|nr:IS30-like element IST3091 family transposase [Acidithiobacillus ferrooxidans]MCL4525328.1 IS30-like element IST3091 family transposase [Gammaproteobacteria bacterium]MBU2775863.1 IS30-like element IST3091 family transposase [Acidithiobacillus ferrooxidans]MBU2816268.1 IS30-like element IST3091 family transposase [Acidithiobacillus ferrooxidans]MCR0970001.1 IS30-like element IST3091 family transposase [Acidithiobacillus ferrooxidans]MCR1341764.1 IS30-like element IST3091 family transposase [
MGTRYQQLQSEQRNQIQRGLNEGLSMRAVAKQIGRSPSTVSREVRRGLVGETYDAIQGREEAQRRLRKGVRKLVGGAPLTNAVTHAILQRKWSPEQVAGRLRMDYPEDKQWRVSHETIYQFIYAHPAGELRKALIAALRQGHAKRKPRTRGKDRRGQLRNMRSIGERPLEAQDREIPGHWEGDFIKGAFNGSAIGTLVERSSRFVLLVRMEGTDADAALEGFTRRMRTLPKSILRTLTYDQGKEMARHEELERKVGIRIYFADPHSPWQRPTNENTNGLLRQYFPKGTDLSGYSQRRLTQVAEELNNRPRKSLGFRTPAEVIAQQIMQLNSGVALQI